MSAPARALALILASGCALEQRPSVEVVDAPLRAHGVELRAGDAPRGQIRLGPYTVRDIVRDRDPDRSPLLPEALPRPSRFDGLRFALVAPEDRTWRAECRSQRRQARNADLAGEADESRDEVGLECRLSDPSARTFSLAASGDLGRGLHGELRGAAAGKPIFELEVIVQRKLLRFVERELPIPVARLSRGKSPAAAMLLDAPERAWLAPKLPDDERALALAVMTAVRLLPLDEAGG
jgi:hypothetical protein